MPRLPLRLFLATVVLVGTLPPARVGAQSISAQSPGAAEALDVEDRGALAPGSWPT